MKSCNCALPSMMGPDVCDNCVNNTDKDYHAPLSATLQHDLDVQTANIKILIDAAHQSERFRIINIIRQVQAKYSTTNEFDILFKQKLDNIIKRIEGTA